MYMKINRFFEVEAALSGTYRLVTRPQYSTCRHICVTVYACNLWFHPYAPLHVNTTGKPSK